MSTEEPEPTEEDADNGADEEGLPDQDVEEQE
jgi:hypothetical protein